MDFLSSLSESTQRRVIELIWHLPELSDAQMAVLSKCVVSAPLCLSVKQYLVQIVHHK